MSTHRPIPEEYRTMMQGVARALDETFNKNAKGADRKVGFCLLVFPFDDKDPIIGERINYISNAERKDMVTALKELVARFEGRDLIMPETKQ